MMSLEDDFDLTVQGAERAEPLNPNEHQPDQPGKKPRDRRKDREEQEEAGDHFEELSKAAEIAHQRLEEQGSPYRFCVYKENGDIMIDIVLLDASGKIKKLVKKNLTHEDFLKWMRRMDESEGIVIDDLV